MSRSNSSFRPVCLLIHLVLQPVLILAVKILSFVTGALRESRNKGGGLVSFSITGGYGVSIGPWSNGANERVGPHGGMVPHAEAGIRH